MSNTTASVATNIILLKDGLTSSSGEKQERGRCYCDNKNKINGINTIIYSINSNGTQKKKKREKKREEGLIEGRNFFFFKKCKYSLRRMMM